MGRQVSRSEFALELSNPTHTGPKFPVGHGTRPKGRFEARLFAEYCGANALSLALHSLEDLGQSFQLVTTCFEPSLLYRIQ